MKLAVFTETKHKKGTRVYTRVLKSSNFKQIDLFNNFNNSLLIIKEDKNLIKVKKQIKSLTFVKALFLSELSQIDKYLNGDDRRGFDIPEFFIESRCEFFNETVSLIDHSYFNRNIYFSALDCLKTFYCQILHDENFNINYKVELFYLRFLITQMLNVVNFSRDSFTFKNLKALS
ncbi:MAG: hypothetical protein PHW95_05475 [Patescibacteria group bacterium]|nr:hypothetical protein [Patescibacteria group bacterium]